MKKLFLATALCFSSPSLSAQTPYAHDTLEILSSISLEQQFLTIADAIQQHERAKDILRHPSYQTQLFDARPVAVIQAHRWYNDQAVVWIFDEDVGVYFSLNRILLKNGHTVVTIHISKDPMDFSSAKLDYRCTSSTKCCVGGIDDVNFLYIGSSRQKWEVFFSHIHTLIHKEKRAILQLRASIQDN
jgi:hypothetical protein